MLLLDTPEDERLPATANRSRGEPAFNSHDVTFSYPDPLPLAECRRAPR